jgi:insulysin
LIRNNNSVYIWYKIDFRVLKVNFFVYFKTIFSNNIAGNFLKAKLYTKMVCDILNEYTYDAELVNLMYVVLSHLINIQIIISSYNKIFLVLLEKILVIIKDLEIKPYCFEIIKEKFLKKLGNFVFIKLYKQIIWFI